jgi:capsular polysaccharide biosynthesis protein
MLRKTSEEPTVPADTSDPSISVPEIVRALLRHKKLIATCVFSSVIIGVLYWLVVPASYTATSLILVDPQHTSAFGSLGRSGAATTRAEIQDQIEVLRSDKIAAATIRKLRLLSNPELSGNSYPQIERFIRSLTTGLFEFLRLPRSTYDAANAEAAHSVVRRRFKDRLSVGRVPNSNVVEVGFTTHDPEMSAAVANAIVDEFIQYWLSPSVAPGSIPDNLVRDRVILSPAAPPLRRDQPGGATILATALILGLLSSAAGVLALEYADRSFRLPQQAEALTQIRCLGLLPKLTVRRSIRDSNPGHAGAFLISKKNGLEWSSYSGASQFLANLHRIELGVDLHPRGGGISTLGVTSALASEGKTTAVINLARVLAQRSANVLVVDCDASNPELSRLLGRTKAAESFSSQAIFNPQAASLPGGERFHFLPIASFLLSNQKAEFGPLKAVVGNYDVILLDMPPLSTADALSAAVNLADALILIIKWGSTSQSIVSKSLDLGDHIRSRLVGSVLNKVDFARLGRWDPDARLLYCQGDTAGLSPLASSRVPQQQEDQICRCDQVLPQ